MVFGDRDDLRAAVYDDRALRAAFQVTVSAESDRRSAVVADDRLSVIRSGCGSDLRAASDDHAAIIAFRIIFVL